MEQVILEKNNMFSPLSVEAIMIKSDLSSQIMGHFNCHNKRFDLKFAKNLQKFEITKIIYSNSERSEQFLVTECFFNLFLEVSHI